MSDWQRLDQIVTTLAAAPSWRQALDGVQDALGSAATIYRLTHRGRKLSGTSTRDSFWVSHYPPLQQMLQEQVPCPIDEGAAEGYWLPWCGGAVRGAARADRHWLQTVATLLDRWPVKRAPSEPPADALKALHQLNELSWVIHRTTDLAEFLRQVPEAVGRHLEASHCALVQFGAGEEIGRVIAGWEHGKGRPSWAGLSFARSSPLGQSLHSVSAGRWRPDPEVLPECVGGRTSQLFCDADTLLAPMHDGTRRIGLLLVRHANPKSQRLVRLLSAIAEQVAAGLLLRQHHVAEKLQSQISQTVYAGAPAALAVLDSDGVLLSANDAAGKLLGPLPEGPFPLYRLLSGPDRQRLTEAWLDLEGGRTVEIENANFHRLDGTTGELGYRLKPLSHDEQPGAPAVVMSLQDRVSSGARLQELEDALARWEGLGDSLSQAVAVVDASHRLIWCNGAALPGGSSRQGCCHALFFDPQSGSCLAIQALSEGVTRTVTHEGTDGQWAVRIRPVTRQDGTIVGAIGLSQPAPVRDAGVEAERWALLGRLVPPTRHDLHNPLGVIHGRLEALRLEGAASPHLEAIERATDRLGQILKELGDWQVRPGDPELLDFAGCAQATLAALEAPLRAQGLQWTLQPAAEPLMMWAVQEDLRVLLAHLFLAPGRQRPPCQLTLQLEATAGWAELHLSGWHLANSAWLAEGILARVGGRWATDPASAKPCLQLPRWLGRPIALSPT